MIAYNEEAMFVVFNILEAIFWFVLGLLIYMKTKEERYYSLKIMTSTTLIVFGVTDLIEVKTGGWDRPIGLLVLNSICVLSLIGCFVKYKSIKRKYVRY